MAARENDVDRSMNQSKSMSRGVAHYHQMNSGNDSGMINNNQEMGRFEQLKSKLNPMAPEFVPSHDAAGEKSAPKKKYRSRRRRPRAKPKAKRKLTPAEAQNEQVRRTVYVSNIDNQITEEQLAALFLSCGQLVDCRICGDPNSQRRFGFVEFAEEECARDSLRLGRTMLGSHAICVVPSRSAIAPVDRRLLPRSDDERERCTRTVYCTNIHRETVADEIIFFFESYCGEVLRLRLFESSNHKTCAAFVEFATSESAVAALDCSGLVLGALPIRVNPSKTPIKLGFFPGMSLPGRS